MNFETILLDIDPRQATRLDPDVAVIGDAKDSVAALTAALAAIGAPRADRSAQFGAVKRRIADQTRGASPELEYLAAIRQVLPRDGFFVDGGRDGEPFLVACASRARRRALSPFAELAAYTTALTAAGMHVEPQTGPDASPLVLQVQFPET